MYKNNIFTSLGFNYLGPVDGHNIAAMEKLFTVAKSYTRPVLIHVVTTKGKGYPHAENEPKDYHVYLRLILKRAKIHIAKNPIPM